MEPKKAEGAAAEKASEAPIIQKLPLSIRKLVGAHPERDWSKIRAFVVESEEEQELVELLPEINRVMRLVPARLMGRIWKREIAVDQPDKAYTRLHDAIHGVRQAALELLELAGLLEYRHREHGSAGSVPECPSPEVSPPAAGSPGPLARLGGASRTEKT